MNKNSGLEIHHIVIIVIVAVIGMPFFIPNQEGHVEQVSSGDVDRGGGQEANQHQKGKKNHLSKEGKRASTDQDSGSSSKKNSSRGTTENAEQTNSAESESKKDEMKENSTQEQDTQNNETPDQNSNEEKTGDTPGKKEETLNTQPTEQQKERKLRKLTTRARQSADTLPAPDEVKQMSRGKLRKSTRQVVEASKSILHAIELAQQLGKTDKLEQLRKLRDHIESVKILLQKRLFQEFKNNPSSSG